MCLIIALHRSTASTRSITSDYGGSTSTSSLKSVNSKTTTKKTETSKSYLKPPMETIREEPVYTVGRVEVPNRPVSSYTYNLEPKKPLYSRDKDDADDNPFLQLLKASSENKRKKDALKKKSQKTPAQDNCREKEDGDSKVIESDNDRPASTTSIRSNVPIIITTPKNRISEPRIQAKLVGSPKVVDPEHEKSLNADRVENHQENIIEREEWTPAYNMPFEETVKPEKARRRTKPNDEREKQVFQCPFCNHRTRTTNRMVRHVYQIHTTELIQETEGRKDITPFSPEFEQYLSRPPVIEFKSLDNINFEVKFHKNKDLTKSQSSILKENDNKVAEAGIPTSYKYDKDKSKNMDRPSSAASMKSVNKKSNLDKYNEVAEAEIPTRYKYDKDKSKNMDRPSSTASVKSVNKISNIDKENDYDRDLKNPSNDTSFNLNRPPSVTSMKVVYDKDTRYEHKDGNEARTTIHGSKCTLDKTSFKCSSNTNTDRPPNVADIGNPKNGSRTYTFRHPGSTDMIDKNVNQTEHERNSSFETDCKVKERISNQKKLEKTRYKSDDTNITDISKDMTFFEALLNPSNRKKHTLIDQNNVVSEGDNSSEHSGIKRPKHKEKQNKGFLHNITKKLNKLFSRDLNPTTKTKSTDVDTSKKATAETLMGREYEAVDKIAADRKRKSKEQTKKHHFQCAQEPVQNVRKPASECAHHDNQQITGLSPGCDIPSVSDTHPIDTSSHSYAAATQPSASTEVSELNEPEKDSTLFKQVTNDSLAIFKYFF